MGDTICQRLYAMQDVAYKAFTAKLIPNISPESIVGIRIPILRKFAKDLDRNDPEAAMLFLQDLPHALFEENNLHAYLIETIKDYDRCMSECERFLPYIDNWATCDTFSPKIFLKYPDEVYEKIKIWLQDDKVYTVRYAIGLLLSNYLDDKFTAESMRLVSQVKNDDYYVKMMIAWYFSTALVKRYEQALSYIQNFSLEAWTHNKAIQKATESRRISPEIKEKLRAMLIYRNEKNKRRTNILGKDLNISLTDASRCE